MSNGIRTIDPHEKSDGEILDKIRAVISQAQCVYILGFGFDRNNCNRIGLTPSNFEGRQSSLTPKNILFTNYGNSSRVNKAASNAFLRHPNGLLGQSTIRKDYYEKSIHDCYGAFAFDFDEAEEN